MACENLDSDALEGEQSQSLSRTPDIFALQTPRFASPGAVESDSTEVARPDDLIAERRDRIDVKMEIVGHERELEIRLGFYNPYRCDWVGNLFLERESPDDGLHTLGRVYQVRIRGGGYLAGTLIIPKPEGAGPHVFYARAYRRDGLDRERFLNLCAEDSVTAADACPEPVVPVEELLLADEVLEATLGPADDESDREPLLACAGDADRLAGPIFTDLLLWPQPTMLEVVSLWRNELDSVWRGDLYVDITRPNGRIDILDRLLGVDLDSGERTWTHHLVDKPRQPGVHGFAARALARDGSAVARWMDPGTTEILAVCNAELCELIEPEQREARIVLTGPSSIHLVSDFFSEYTQVSMAYGGWEFDITDLCHITQVLDDSADSIYGRNHIEVRFNTMDLPIGPRTWALYTIRLNPMPVVPPGAKTHDAIRILTNGPE